MKIIGKTAGGFLLDATHSEIANIVGKAWAGEMGYRPEIGTTINVSDIYLRLDKLSGHRKLLDRVASDLRDVANLIEARKETITKALDAEATKS